MSRAIVHIGTLKTGTSSLQSWAARNRRQLLRRAGIRTYRGRFSTAHYEFPLLCLREDRDLDVRRRHSDWRTPRFQARVRRHIAHELDRDDSDILISAEGLSLLRHADELDALTGLLGARQATFVLCLRDRQGYLDSYRAQMAAMGIAPSSDPDSFAYTEDDSWVADYDAIRRAFGSPVEVDYDQAVGGYGSIIPAFFETVGVEPRSLPDWDTPWVNRTGASPSTPRVVARARSLAGRLKRARIFW